MIRAALYARYSSDLQSAASIEDQFRICRDHAERAGWAVVDTYRDAAISGDSMILRPGIQAVLADARSGAFDVVVAEALDRMSRDQADVSALFKHLQFARVMIVTLAEGGRELSSGSASGQGVEAGEAGRGQRRRQQVRGQCEQASLGQV